MLTQCYYTCCSQFDAYLHLNFTAPILSDARSPGPVAVGVDPNSTYPRIHVSTYPRIHVSCVCVPRPRVRPRVLCVVPLLTFTHTHCVRRLALVEMHRLSRSLSKRLSRSSRHSKSDRSSYYSDNESGGAGDGTEQWFPGLAASASGASTSSSSPRRSTSFVTALSRRSFSTFRVAGSSDEEVRLHVAAVVSRQQALLVTLGELEQQRGNAAHDHNAFLSSDGFAHALRELQSCQQQQKTLLAEGTRVHALCPVEYPEMLRLSVDVMTTFSRVAAKPEEVENAPQSITDNGQLRHRSLSASI